MGRRALRKVDPNLEYGNWLLTVEELAARRAMGETWSIASLFDRRAPLEIELGSGKGLFLSNAAAIRPEHDFVGLEMARKYAHFAAARLARSQLPNVRIVHGDGLRVFRELLPADSLAAVHVYFPDPWWKARHKKRRAMNDRFLCDVERTLHVGGVLHFWTDVEEYFQTTLALVVESTRLAGPYAVEEKAPAHDLDYRTHFERRTRLGGKPVYRAEFRKAAPRDG
jgi:tRNA (guanine-N7-)-methyltransferase